MASRKSTALRPRTTKDAAAGEQDSVSSDVPSRASAKSIAPLIPKRLAYKYDHDLMQEHYDNLLTILKAHHAAHCNVTPKRYQTANLVTLICRLYEKNLPEEEHDQCDEAVKKCLPVREHHAAFMTHSMFVTMVGMIVARALEQANAAVGSKKNLGRFAPEQVLREKHNHSRLQQDQCAGNRRLLGDYGVLHRERPEVSTSRRD